MTPAAFADQLLTWARRIAVLTLTLIALAMLARIALGAMGIAVAWRLPPLDQSTGIALAALAYVITR